MNYARQSYDGRWPLRATVSGVARAELFGRFANGKKYGAMIGRKGWFHRPLIAREFNRRGI